MWRRKWPQSKSRTSRRRRNNKRLDQAAATSAVGTPTVASTATRTRVSRGIVVIFSAAYGEVKRELPFQIAIQPAAMEQCIGAQP